MKRYLSNEALIYLIFAHPPTKDNEKFIRLLSRLCHFEESLCPVNLTAERYCNGITLAMLWEADLREMPS